MPVVPVLIDVTIAYARGLHTLLDFVGVRSSAPDSPAAPSMMSAVSWTM